MVVLVLNAGSSSLKYAAFAVAGGRLDSVAAGTVGRIGEAGGDAPDHAAAVARAFDRLGLAGPGRVAAVGHRVVHGGEAFDRPALVDEAALAAIRRASPLAPLHNPAALAGIEAARALLPGVPQVAVFDTAFHQTVPPEAYRYALPAWCYDRFRVRRYGMHGISHASASRRAAGLLGRPPEETNVITLHLGNGASAAAVAGGRCAETSMGFTPLEGLVMGTRCGDLDPAVTPFLCREAGLTPAEVDRLLNRESGLTGLCGDGDMRAVLGRAASGDAAAELALAVYCHRVRKYVGAYAAVLGRVDAVAFTAGVGENAPEVRRRVCAGLGVIGVRLDDGRNRAARGGPADVAADDSPARVFVLPADEEREIARDALATVAAAPDDVDR